MDPGGRTGGLAPGGGIDLATLRRREPRRGAHRAMRMADEGLTTLTLRLERVRQVLGADISGEQRRDDPVRLRPGENRRQRRRKPTGACRRSGADLTREIDLIEEVARVYGLDRVEGRAEARTSRRRRLTDHAPMIS